MVAEIARSEGKPMDKKAAYRASSSTILTVQPNALKQGQIFDMAAGWRNWRPRRGTRGLTGCKKGCWLALILRGGRTQQQGGCAFSPNRTTNVALEAVQTFLCPVSPHTRVYSIFDFLWLVDLSNQMSSIEVYRKSPHLVSKAPHR